LSTLAEIAVERNSTIVFPLPFEIMRVFEGMAHRLEGSTVPAPPSRDERPVVTPIGGDVGTREERHTSGAGRAV
jgi:hypothetical protein